MTERFQPRTLASFSRHQLEQILLWSERNGLLDFHKRGLGFQEAFTEILERAEIDEKGNPLFSFGSLETLKTMSVWLVSEAPPVLQFRWKHVGDTLESMASETRFYGRV